MHTAQYQQPQHQQEQKNRINNLSLCGLWNAMESGGLGAHGTGR